MGRELIENYPVYNASLVDSARILREFDASWDLMGSYTSLPNCPRPICHLVSAMADEYDKTS